MKILPVGVATGYGLDVPGSNPGANETFRTCPDRPWGPPSLLHNGYRGVTLTLHPLLVPRSKNRIELYIYSP
jgi:hypothetical protein